MPTLSGWLLQYPVVYLAYPDTAGVMAQLLSETVLVLYDVQIAGPFVQVVVRVIGASYPHFCLGNQATPRGKW